MKTRFLAEAVLPSAFVKILRYGGLCVVLFGFALISGCVTTDTTAANASGSRTKVQEEVEEQVEETPRIRVGMTKAQVRRAWGEPSGKEVSSRGEIWVYGNQRALRMIPYAGPWLNVNTSKVIFGPHGRVQDFRSTDEGNVFSAGEGRWGSGFSPW